MASSDSDGPSSSGSEAALKSSVHPGNNAWITAGIIIADVVGAGILSVANAVAHFGWLLGSLLIVALLAMNIHVSLLMWRAKMRHPEAKDYMGLVQAVFKNAPARQRRFMTGVTAVSQYAFIFSIMGLYVLSFGKGLGMAFYDTHVCLPIWALIGCAIVLPFCLTARAMGTWKALVWINILTILGSIIIPLADMMSRGVEETRPTGSKFQAVADDLTFRGALSGLSTFTFAFTSQFMLMEIMSEMKDVRELPKAYVGISAPFQLMAFLIVGFGGYYYQGSAVHGMIADNIPFGPSFRAAAGCLMVHMLIVYQIKGIVLCRAVHSALHPSSVDEDSRLAWVIWCGLVIAVCALAFTTSQLVPFFSDFVDLLGALLAPLCCLIIPTLAYLRSLFPTPSAQKAAMDAKTRSCALDEPGQEAARGLVTVDSEINKGQEAEISQVSDMSSSGDESSDSEGGVTSARGPRSRTARIAEGLLIATELLLAVILTVFGTYAAVTNIVSNWGTYGYPFSCHCEGIWSTCACSGGHAGMETCPASPGLAA